MATAMSAPPGSVIVTHVYPQQPTAPPTVPCNMQAVSSAFTRFMKGEPKALGTVQVMIGLLTFVLGIVLVIFPDRLAIYSGVVFYAPIFFFISGGLTIGASNKESRCLVNGALGMNIVSTIFAVLSIILHAMDLIFYMGNSCYEYDYSSGHYIRSSMCTAYMERTMGISGVLLVFSILQFFICISLSAFGCKAVCCYNPEVVVITQQQVPGVIQVAPVPTQDAQWAHMNQPNTLPHYPNFMPRNDNQMMMPPSYNELVK